jgi:hypothetical protein
MHSEVVGVTANCGLQPSRLGKVAGRAEPDARSRLRNGGPVDSPPANVAKDLEYLDVFPKPRRQINREGAGLQSQVSTGTLFLPCGFQKL